MDHIAQGDAALGHYTEAEERGRKELCKIMNDSFKILLGLGALGMAIVALLLVSVLGSGGMMSGRMGP
jgi:hypothetical protein